MRIDVTEKLNAVITWLSFEYDDLSFGLRTAEDAIKLYDYAQANPGLPEFTDRWEVQTRIDALGYDPLA